MHEPLVIADAMAATLSEAESSFEANELAYLALTSKVELPIRDRVAWHLQLALGNDYVVSREWRRADIAVLRQNVPLVQVEAKAMYAFDLLSAISRAKYLAKLTSDGRKMASLAPGCDAYLLALVTHVDGSIATHLRQHVVKYSSGIRGALSRQGSAAVVLSKSRELWEADLAKFTTAPMRFTLDGGVMWDMSVHVDAYLVGPLSSGGEGVKEQPDQF